MPLATEDVALLGVIDPDANSTGTLVTDWGNAQKFNRFMATVFAGTIVTTGTVDAKLEQATSSTGAGAKDITGASITQLTTASDDKQQIINLLADELDVTNSFDFVRLSITLTTAGADLCGSLHGLSPRNAPASDNDNASVTEIVSVP